MSAHKYANMNFNQIHNVIEDFYSRAFNDEWIGYHFQHIEHLPDHIDRVARFWFFQFHQKKVDGYQDEHFNLIQTHMPLRATSGQLNRWVMLFNQTLEIAVKNKILGPQDHLDWMESIHRFKKIFENNQVLLR